MYRSIRPIQGIVLAATLALTTGCPTTAAPPTTTGKIATTSTAKPPKLPGTSVAGPKATALDTTSNAAADGDLGKPGRTLMAIYVVGSTLEDATNQNAGNKSDEEASGTISTSGAASTNFRELIRGYKGLTDSEKKNVDFLIMFGGARKQGWQGVKVCNVEQLMADADDDYFGNATDYISTDPKADMGDEKTFESFLKMVQAHKGDASKVFVDLWDHGGSYGGVGPDMNSQGVLSLASIKQALDATNFQGDYIGFDACLMASVEVSGFVKDHFSYLLASEEEEPGHGWDYELNTKFMGQHPEATLPDLGKAMVDSFIDAPSHLGTHGKTLSVVNLKAVSSVLSKLETLATTLGGAKLASVYAPLVQAVSGVRTRYGSEGKGHDEVSVDLQALSASIQATVPDGAAAASDLSQAIKGAVVYTRDDGGRPNSNGLSVFSIANVDAIKTNTYNAQNAAPALWYNFVASVASFDKDDKAKPDVGAEKMQADGSSTVSISDKNGIAEADVVHGVSLNAPNAYHLFEVGSPKILEVEEDTEERTPNDANLFVQPAWDGTFLELAEGGKKLPAPLTHDEGQEGEFHSYSGAVQWRGEDALLFVVLDKAGNVSASYVVPLITNAQGIQVQEREQYALEAGDTLAFYNTIYDVDTDTETDELSQTVTLGSDTPNFIRSKADGTAVIFSKGQDLQGNSQNSTPRVVN